MRYAAFLRGINLGATTKIAMPALRTMTERLGYSDVRTYINSGNLLFSATGTDLELTQALQQAISREFGLRIDVAVRTEPELRDIVASNPFPDGDPSRVTVAFLMGPPPVGVEQRLAAVAGPEEPFIVARSEVWIHYVHGQAASKLSAQVSKVIGVSATVRNVRTVAKVVEMFG